MRQAIVITNPKWELFTTASDAFKKLSLKEKESAVLVERGRCKERSHARDEKKFFKNPHDSAEGYAVDLKKQGKSPEEITKAVAAFGKKAAKAALLIFALMFSLPAMAQQDMRSLLPATTFAGSTTNTSIGNGIIGFQPDQVAVLQYSITQSNVAHISTISNSIVRFDTSIDGTYWVTNAYALNLTPSGTTNTTAAATVVPSVGITRITNTVGGKWLRVGVIENVNTNRVSIASLLFWPIEQ